MGGQLSVLLQPLGKLVILGKDDLDLTQADRIRETLREVRPQVIVNAAAYTAVPLHNQPEERLFGNMNNIRRFFRPRFAVADKYRMSFNRCRNKQ